MKQGKMQLVDVEMQNVELIGLVIDPVEHEHVIGDRIVDVGIQPQRRWNTTYELCGCDRISTCKQRHIMPQTDQFVSEVGYDAFGTAIQPWWHALDERRNLRNFHWNLQHFADVTRTTFAARSSRARCVLGADGPRAACPAKSNRLRPSSRPR